MINKNVEMMDHQVNAICKYIKKDDHVLEVGAYAGKGTVIFAKLARKVITIDPFINNYDKTDLTYNQDMDEIYNIFKQNIEGYDNIFHIKQKSQDVVKDIQETFDILVLDGDHSTESFILDVAWIDYVKIGGIFAIHDYSDYFPWVKEYCDAFDEEHEEYQLLEKVDNMCIFKRLK